MAINLKQAEEYAAKYGEAHLLLIIDALEWLDEHEGSWGLETPINKEAFISGLLSRAVIRKGKADGRQ